MSMQVYKISDMNRGWFVGDFEPSVFQNPFFEVAHHKHKQGEPTEPHVHKISTELNYILKGELIASGQHLKTGDIWVYEKNEESKVEFLTDVEIIVVRWPSIPTDKHIL